MIRTITVSRVHRVALFRDGAFERLLGPGQHVLWTGLSTVETLVLPFDDTAAAIDPAQGLPVQLDGSEVVEVAAHELAVLRVDGRDRQLLRPGRYRLWRTGARQELLRFDVLAEPGPLPAEDRLELGQGSAWTEQAADAERAVVLVRDGLPLRVLGAGRYRAWTSGPWKLVPVHLGLEVLELAAQDVVTQDQVPVRVKPAATFRVVDPLRWLASRAQQVPIYSAIQLALREVLAGRTLDALTLGREDLSDDLLQRSRARLPAELGVALDTVWVKDLILPGEVKEVVHRVTLARKEAEAMAIRRREEVAQTRQLANTARLLEQSPVLLRLKELEAMGELVGQLSGKLEKLVLVGGEDLARPFRLQGLVDETR